MLLALLLVVGLTPQPTCADLSSCRDAALEAKARNDYEAFHDLAWLAYRKGKPDDPELMLLLARAQSLSGRPGDALVMLGRLAARGTSTDVATSPDFEAVRSHPRWSASTNEPAPSAPSSEASKAPSAEPKAPSGDLSAVARSAKVEVPKAPSREAAPAPSAEAPKAPSREATPAPSAEAPKAPSRAALSFTTLLSPSALAYDAVSKRYLIADRRAKRIAVVDENTGHVSTLAGGLAGLGEIHGIAIDVRQGDLWVVTSASEGMSLSRLQLISGRELGASRITGIPAPITAVAFVRGAGLVASDAQGDLWRLSASGKADKIGSLEYAPTGMAADTEGTLYIAAGGPRLARFSVVPSFRRLGVIDLGEATPPSLPFVVVGDRVHLLVPNGGAFEVRIVKK